MFARDHTAAGAMIALAVMPHAPDPVTAALIAAPLALLSHFALDLLGEHDFGSVGVNAALEAMFLAAIGAILFAAGIHGHAIAVIGATIFAANLPDITDKRLYLTFVNPDRWPMRRWWYCHRDGWAQVRLSGPVTILVSATLTGALYALTLV